MKLITGYPTRYAKEKINDTFCYSLILIFTTLPLKEEHVETFSSLAINFYSKSDKYSG